MAFVADALANKITDGGLFSDDARCSSNDKIFVTAKLHRYRAVNQKIIMYTFFCGDKFQLFYFSFM